MLNVPSLVGASCPEFRNVKSAGVGIVLVSLNMFIFGHVMRN